MADAPGPALSLLLVDEVPAGLYVLDVLAKEAEVSVLRAGTIQNGAWLVLFGGEVGPVTRSHARALAAGGAHVKDEALLPHAEPRIAPAVLGGGVRWPAPGDTLGVLQAPTPPVLFAAVDAALKGAQVELVELRLADGLGGKATASLWGETHDVQAAVDLARGVFEGRAAASTAIIPRADAAVHAVLGAPSRFFGEWRG
jgi:microcompartment protein CcmL/EutN